MRVPVSHVWNPDSKQYLTILEVGVGTLKNSLYAAKKNHPLAYENRDKDAQDRDAAMSEALHEFKHKHGYVKGRGKKGEYKALLEKHGHELSALYDKHMHGM